MAERNPRGRGGLSRLDNHNEFLMAPMQRVMRYPMLLDAILKAVKKDGVFSEVGVPVLLDAQTATAEVCKRANTLKAATEDFLPAVLERLRILSLQRAVQLAEEEIRVLQSVLFTPSAVLLYLYQRCGFGCRCTLMIPASPGAHAIVGLLGTIHLRGYSIQSHSGLVRPRQSVLRDNCSNSSGTIQSTR